VNVKMGLGIYVVDYYFWMSLLTLALVLASIVLLGLKRPSFRE
jgi:hypothetical protein